MDRELRSLILVSFLYVLWSKINNKLFDVSFDVAHVVKYWWTSLMELEV